MGPLPSLLATPVQLSLEFCLPGGSASCILPDTRVATTLESSTAGSLGVLWGHVSSARAFCPRASAELAIHHRAWLRGLVSRVAPDTHA